MPEIPFHHVGDDNIIALKKLADIFKISTEHQNNNDSVQRVDTNSDIQERTNNSELRNDKNENSRKEKKI